MSTRAHSPTSPSRSPVLALALALGAAALAGACGSGNGTYLHPDGISPWPSNRTTVTVPDGGIGLVSNNGSDQVSVLDLAANMTMANIRVGIDPIGNDGPHHLAVDPVGRTVFVGLAFPPPGIPSGPHAGHGTSTVPGWVQALALSDFHEIARAEIDPNPGEIVITPDHRRVIVSHFNLAQAADVLANHGTLMDAYSHLIVLDAADLHRLATVPLCVMAHGVAVSADGTRAYVACNGQDSLAIVHLDDPAYAVEPLLPVGAGAGAAPSVVYGPYAVLLTRDGQYALVSDREGRDLRIFNIATHAFEDEHALSLRASVWFGAESPDGRFFFFPTQTPDGIARVRRSDWGLDTFRPVDRADCLYPHEISLGPDGRYYLVCEAVGADTARTLPSRVLVIDPDALTVTARFDVGVYPDRIVFVPGGAR
jgi:YVTN family beta-propeller protein